MHRCITIPYEALNYLFSILEATPYVSHTEARKQRIAFDVMRGHIEKYKESMRNVENTYRVYSMMKDEKGNDVEGWTISRERRPAYEAAVNGVHELHCKVCFDPESLALVQRVFNGIFERPEVKEKGIQGEQQARYIDQITMAFEGVKTED